MNTERPPRFPKWLLRHFASSANIEAMIGDLDERYGQGRSSVWYWRQVAVAIAVSTFNDIRSHKLLALCAMTVGWAVWSIVILFNSRILGMIDFAMGRYPNIYPLLLTCMYAPFAVASGWLVAHLNPTSRRGTVLLYAASWWVVHTVLLAQMVLARFAFSIDLIPHEAKLIGIRAGIDAALVVAIVVGGMLRVHRTSRQLPCIA